MSIKEGEKKRSLPAKHKRVEKKRREGRQMQRNIAKTLLKFKHTIHQE